MWFLTWKSRISDTFMLLQYESCLILMCRTLFLEVFSVWCCVIIVTEVMEIFLVLSKGEMSVCVCQIVQ